MKVYECPDCDYTDEETSSVAGHMLRNHSKHVFDENLDEYLDTVGSYQSNIDEHKRHVAPTHTEQKQTENKGFVRSFIDTLKSILSG